jgi:GxxExxY protein
MQALAEQVWSELGPGYTESIYHKALEVLLREKNIPYETERIIPVPFHGHNVGHLRADLIIQETIVVELKSVKNMTESCRQQLRIYMKLLNYSTGFLINFGNELEIEKI